MKLSEVSTIRDTIRYGKDLDITHEKLFYKSTINTVKTNRKIIVNHESVINKYYYIFLKYTYEVDLTDIEYLHYRYQPKLFCYETYGTTELWSLLLKVNNLTSCREFTLQKLRIFDLNILDIINEILILESDEMEKNKADNGL